MNIEQELVKHADAIIELQARLDALERANRKANLEQSAVARPDVGDSENLALARPVTIAKLKAWIKKEFNLEEERWQYGDFGQGMMAAAEKILKRLDDLDQGTIVSSYTKQFESQIGKCEPVDGYDP